MRAALLYPPDFNRPTMVFGALPLFNACLKEAGHSTLVADTNAEAFSYALLPGNLERYFEIFDRLCAEFAGKKNRSPEEAAQLRGLRSLTTYPRELMLEARDAAAGLRDHDRFFQPELYRHFDRVIRTTHRFLNSFTIKVDSRHEDYTKDLYGYLEGDSVDPYLEYYENDLIPRLAAFQPDLIAMSCPFSPQVATGMFAARIIRKHLPKVRFVMGGTGVSDTAEMILSDRRFWDYIDYSIVGDGEEALPALCAAMNGERSFDSVPALWRLEGDEITRPSCHDLADLNKSPTPDYRDVDFSHYMLPEKAGIYTTSRGCYYGKCTFCPESFRDGFRRRSAERVYDDVKKMVEEQGIKHLHFFDPLTPPATLARVSKRVAQDGLDLNWYAEVKFDNIYTNEDYVRTLSKGGCRQLQFGFESAVQRVLDKMLKGNDVERIKVIIQRLHQYGISTVATWFLGFPTETREEALQTWQFWRDHAETMQLNLYTGVFSVGPEVPVFNHPEEFGVKIVTGEDGYPHCVAADGNDWNKEELHPTFHTRSDIEVTICGAGLLYATYHPERLYQLRNMNMVGPTSHDAPPIEERKLWAAKENALRTLDPELDGDEGTVGYVAESLQTFKLDPEDVAVLKTLEGKAFLLGSELLASGVERDRLAKLIDLGFLESRDPATADLHFHREPQMV